MTKKQPIECEGAKRFSKEEILPITETQKETDIIVIDKNPEITTAEAVGEAEAEAEANEAEAGGAEINAEEIKGGITTKTEITTTKTTITTIKGIDYRPQKLHR